MWKRCWACTAWLRRVVPTRGRVVVRPAPGRRARLRADRPAGGATLRLLAATIGARAVVEVARVPGFGAVAAQRHAPGGVLTTVDVESEHQRAARERSPMRASPRPLPGDQRLRRRGAARLTDGAYDLVFVDADKSGTRPITSRRCGCCDPGVVAFDNALWHDGSPTTPPGRRDGDDPRDGQGRPMIRGSSRRCCRSATPARRRQALTVATIL